MVSSGSSRSYTMRLATHTQAGLHSSIYGLGSENWGSGCCSLGFRGLGFRV